MTNSTHTHRSPQPRFRGIDEFLNLFSTPLQKAGDGEWKVRCPAHPDKTPSLSIKAAPGKVLIHCFGGCQNDDVCRSLGITTGDLFFEKPKLNRKSKLIEMARYPYRSADGSPSFEIVRFVNEDDGKKTFKVCRKANGKVEWGLNGNVPILFRLPEVIRDKESRLPIIVAEGEKDVLSLVAHCFSATCNPFGAGKWLDCHAAVLAGAESVVVIQDKDQPGEKHAAEVAASLYGKVKSLKVIACPDHGGKPVKDATDYFEAGGKSEDLVSLIDAAPEWKPAPPSGIISLTPPPLPSLLMRGPIRLMGWIYWRKSGQSIAGL